MVASAPPPRKPEPPPFQGPKLRCGQIQTTTTLDVRQLDVTWEDPSGKGEHRISMTAEEAHGRILITVVDGKRNQTLTKSIVASKVQAALKSLIIEQQKLEG